MPVHPFKVYTAENIKSGFDSRKHTHKLILYDFKRKSPPAQNPQNKPLI